MDDEQQEKQHLANDGRQMTLIDQIIRNKVFNCRYWKEDCFGLTAVTLVDKACKLDCVGATYSGTGKPVPFLCLLMKLLQINPDKEIIIEFLKSKDYKYISALAMFYIRLTSKPKEAYPTIEQFYADFRKIRIRNLDGTFAIWHMDELAEKLLSEEIIFWNILAQIPEKVDFGRIRVIGAKEECVGGGIAELGTGTGASCRTIELRKGLGVGLRTKGGGRAEKVKKQKQEQESQETQKHHKHHSHHRK